MFLGIDWNPSPELFRIGNFPLRYYGLMFVVAFTLGIYILKKIYKNDKVNVEHVDTIFVWVVITVILGARLGEVFFYSGLESFKGKYWQIILPIQFKPHFEIIGFRGLASHGAAIGVILGMYFYTRKYTYKPLLWILDRIVVPVAIGGAFVRIGNLMNSEIVGKITNSPLGFRFIRNQIGDREAMRMTNTRDVNTAFDLIENNEKFKHILESVPYRYPSQLFESFGYIIVFIILWFVYWKTNKKEKTGYVFGLFMVLLWSVRFFVEFFKASQGGIESSFNNILTTGQLLSIPMILVGFYFMFRKSKFSKNTDV